MKQFKTIANANGINWKQMARPQDSHYDSEVLATLETARGWKKLNTSVNATTIAGGSVAVVPAPQHTQMGERYPAATIEQVEGFAPFIDTYLGNWPAGFDAVQMFLEEFWPFWSLDMDAASVGCSSGHYVSRKGDPPLHAIYITVNSLAGCAQGIYHEMAHLRLRAMGVGIDEHDGELLKNASDELYTSSVRHDIKRPMSAVLHGVYAWLMFTENDYHNNKFSALSDREWVNASAHNLPKIERGLQEIQKHGKFTSEGRHFMDGLYEWADDLLFRTHIKAQQAMEPDEYRRIMGEFAR
jgi:hypothetical protein